MLGAKEFLDPNSPNYNQSVKVLNKEGSVATKVYHAAIDTIAAELPIKKIKLLRTGFAKAAISTSN